MRAVVSDRATIVVACLGSSSTAGQGQAFGWIDEFSRRPQNARFVFKNLGVGGDFAYDALQRVPAVVATSPDRIFVLVGANDVLAMVFPNVQRFIGRFHEAAFARPIFRMVQGEPRRDHRPAPGGDSSPHRTVVTWAHR